MKHFLIDASFSDDLSETQGATQFAGIYKLHITNEDGAFKELPRLFGLDLEGTVYIGASLTVQYRAAMLKKVFVRHIESWLPISTEVQNTLITIAIKLERRL